MESQGIPRSIEETTKELIKEEVYYTGTATITLNDVMMGLGEAGNEEKRKELKKMFKESGGYDVWEVRYHGSKNVMIHSLEIEGNKEKYTPDYEEEVEDPVMAQIRKFGWHPNGVKPIRGE